MKFVVNRSSVLIEGEQRTERGDGYIQIDLDDVPAISKTIEADAGLGAVLAHRRRMNAEELLDAVKSVGLTETNQALERSGIGPDDVRVDGTAVIIPLSK